MFLLEVLLTPFRAHIVYKIDAFENEKNFLGLVRIFFGESIENNNNYVICSSQPLVTVTDRLRFSSEGPVTRD